jgi:hypothetical protein
MIGQEPQIVILNPTADKSGESMLPNRLTAKR